MKMNLDALKTLELKLAEYSKANGAIAEHTSANSNCERCMTTCIGDCSSSCSGGCKDSCSGRR